MPATHRFVLPASAAVPPTARDALAVTDFVARDGAVSSFLLKRGAWTLSPYDPCQNPSDYRALPLTFIPLAAWRFVRHDDAAGMPTGVDVAFIPRRLLNDAATLRR